MKGYQQISIIERGKIELLLQQGRSFRFIARELGRNVSTISREFKRGLDFSTNKYHCELSLSMHINIKQNKFLLSRFDCLREYVFARLKQSWSPEQIVGRLKKDNICNKIKSPQTIYNYLFREFKRGLLPRKGKKYNYRIQDPSRLFDNPISIHQRPPIIDKRERIGDWELDLVMSPHISKANITTLVDRKTRFMIVTKNATKHQSEVLKGIANILQPLPKQLKMSVTTDRGVEFMAPLYFKEKIGVEVFYCDTSSPWQKGTNENTNGRLRRFFPKKTNFETISKELLDKIVLIMNNTPRKCLNYSTPSEEFYKQKNKVLQLD